MHHLEQLVLIHCAPVLCRVKPASIISCCRYDHETIDDALVEIQKQLARHGCLLVEVCRCEHHITLFIYQRWILTAYLSAPGVSEYLAFKGYTATHDIDEVIHMLIRRYRQQKTVPHEVGVFLGYPLEDVLKFEKHNGRDYKICRYWKVYSDESQAERIFDCYDRCRAKVCELMDTGLAFEDVLKKIA